MINLLPFTAVVKKRSDFRAFFLQPLIPAFCIAGLMLEKGYKKAFLSTVSLERLIEFAKIN